MSNVQKTLPNPDHLWIEPTNRCNTRCIHCGHYYSQFGVDMDSEIYETIRSSVLSSLSRVSLIGYGEPFVSKTFPQMFDDCCRQGLQINITTNGILLKNEELVEKLVTNKVNLTVSVDGATKEAYEFVRPYIKWESLLKSLDTLRAIRARCGSDGFRLSFNFVAMKKTIQDLPLLVEFAAEYGAECIDVLPLGAYDELEGIKDQSLCDDVETERRFFLEAQHRAIQLGVKLVLPTDYATAGAGVAKNVWFLHLFRTGCLLLKNRDYSGIRAGFLRYFGKRSFQKPQKHHCVFPWKDSYISSDGSVLPCCILGAALGDIKTTSWADIWQGFKYRNLRRTIHSWNPTRICRYCPLPAGINAGDFRNHDAFFAGMMVKELDLGSENLSILLGACLAEGGEKTLVLNGKARIQVTVGARTRFLRFILTSDCVSEDEIISGTFIIDGDSEPFDNSCSSIYLPIKGGKNRRKQIDILLDIDPERSTAHPPRLVVERVELLEQ